VAGQGFDLSATMIVADPDVADPLLFETCAGKMGCGVLLEVRLTNVDKLF
jgi:hypothetical protein